MSLDDRLNKEYVQAMKDKDTARSSALNYLRAMIKQVKVDKRLDSIEDSDVVGIIKKQIKQRQDSIEQFEKGGRQDLAAKEQYEVALMKAYLPPEMSADSIKSVVSEVISHTGASSMKDMGNVMKAVRERLAGQADGKLISEIVKDALSSL